MIPIDGICIALYLAIFGVIRTKDSFVVSIAFIISVLYTSSSQWILHDGWLQHLYIALCFFPCLLFTAKKASITILAYISYHWVVSGDYLFFTNETFIGNTFYIISPAINLLIMASLIYARHDRIPTKTHSVASGWLPNILAYSLANKETQSGKSKTSSGIQQTVKEMGKAQ